MNLSTNRFWFRVSTSMRGLLWLSIGVALALSSRLAVGQEPPASAQTEVGDAIEDGWLFGDQYTGRSGQAFGALIRGGVSTGPAIGRETSIFPVELMPYAFADKWMFFTDFRGFRATSDNWGGSLGTGTRYYSERLDRIFGANVFYDYDNSSGALFRDVGFGLETLGNLWDLRANAYFPNGVTDRLLKTTFVEGSQAFVGNQITYSQNRLVGNALTGMDMEVATPLPGRVMKRHDVRWAGGWYYYKGGEVPGFAGWKTRLQANVLPSVQMQVEVTSDKQFDTNVIFGATWTYGGFRQPDGEARTQFNRMTTPVLRNYNVAVGLTTITDTGIVAVNPVTATPYFVEHVASYASGPAFNGTVLDPFLTVADAQANPGADIVFVHADSVFNSGVDLNEPGVRTLGEGDVAKHLISVTTLPDPIPVPRATAFINRPIFQNAPGVGVNLNTLGQGFSTTTLTEFSGFQIGDPTNIASGSVGAGIFGDTVKNFKITQTDVNFANGDGVLLQNLTGLIQMDGVRINDPVGGGTALHILGGTGQVRFGDDTGTGHSGRPGIIVNTGGRALWVENTNAGSIVNLADAEILDTTGQGILIDNSLSGAGGTVTVDTATINQGTTTGVQVVGGNGIVNFRGVLTIDQATGDAVDVRNTLAGSSVTFGTAAVGGAVGNGVTVTNRNGRGINLFNNAGNVSFFGPVSITGITGALVAPAAIEYQSSSGSALFQTLTLNGGADNAILIGAIGSDNTGQFLVSGSTTINNFVGNGVLVTDDDSEVSFNSGLTVVNRGVLLALATQGQSGVNVNNNRGTVVFRGTTSIDNPNGVFSPAVDIQDNATLSSVQFETLTITEATRPILDLLGFPLAGGAGLNVINNLGAVSVNTLNVDSVDGIALFADTDGVITTTVTPLGTTVTTSGGVSVANGIITTAGERPAIEVRDSVMNLSFQAVSSSDSLSDGITLTDNIGPGGGDLFTVTGLNGAIGTGGTITGAVGDGLFLRNTGGVNLSGMNINGNLDDGIDARTTLFAVVPAVTATTNLALINSSVVLNGGFGVQTLTTPRVTLLGNTIRGNGQASEVQLVSAANTNYDYLIGNEFTGNGNIITHAATAFPLDSGVRIFNQGAGIGSDLGLSFVNNTVTQTGIFGTGLRVDWNGPVTRLLPSGRSGADVVLNTFNSTGPNVGTPIVDIPTAVHFNLSSGTATSNVSILSNTIRSTGNGTVGVDVTTQGGPSTITVGRLTGQLLGNSMQFSGLSDVAVQMNLGPNSNAFVTDNTIDMIGDLSQALRFPLIQGTSSLTIERNIITIDDGADLISDERGINILSVAGTVTLFGVENNDIRMYGIRGSGLPYFSAPPNILGNILVNGVLQP